MNVIHLYIIHEIRYHRILLFEATLFEIEKGQCDLKGQKIMKRFKEEPYNYEFIRDRNLQINNEILSKFINRQF